MTKEDKAFLIGCVLGDGSLRKPRHESGCSGIQISHCKQQRDYLMFKAARINTMLYPSKPVKVRKFDNHGYEGYIYEKGHKYFRILRKWIYPKGTKTFSKLILSKLTPEAIALLYMDDGSLSFKKRDGIIHGREFTISTYLSKDENQLIIDYLQEVWGIKMSNVLSKGKYRLRFGTKEGWKFIKLVKPYIVPSMFYKIDLKYTRGVIKDKYEAFLND